MADYSAEHARAYRQVTRKGTDVVFNPSDSDTYSGSGEWTDGASDTIAGKAVEIPGDPAEYEPLELIGKDAATLMFVPTTIGSIPQQGFTATWAGKVRTVKQSFPFRPAGVAIMAKVILT